MAGLYVRRAMVYGSALVVKRKMDKGGFMGRAVLLLMVLALALPAPVRAEDATPAPAPAPAPVLTQPLPPVAQTSPPVEEPVVVRPAILPPPVELVPPQPAVSLPATASPVPSPPPMTPSPPVLWLVAGGGLACAMLALGAAFAGWIGARTARSIQVLDETRRRDAARAMLAAELDARRQAFEAVPVPPNAEAGVSFVSAVVALSEMDGAWRAAQPSLHLLGEKQAGHLSVHYGAVRYVANFVKGQSFAASLRMLQANRIGGHPCPDPATMREAHVELAAAFRGVDKIIAGLKG